MGETLIIFLFGSMFGIIIQYAKLNKYNVISAQAQLKNNTVIKTILLTIGFGAILLSVIIGLDLAVFHIKPFVIGGVVLGGLIFGSGMAILGYCPGTMAVSLGEGSLDAFIGIIGGLFGGLFFTILLPNIQWLLGPNLGEISLFSAIGNHQILYYAIAFIIGAILIYSAFLINKKEKVKDKKWITAGILLAVLNSIVFLKLGANRPIGASTSYPYLADLLTNTTNNNYFVKIQTPGNWEMIFLFGAMIAALIISLIKKEFKFRLIYSNWQKQKGNSKIKRIIWAFFGGFILIFGARMAGGCTSGHIISGGMQIAVSSFVFAIFMFLALVVTGKLFLNKS
ncbi:MAG: YeeE/YedE family protein [Bacteroidales bacterium]|nr:YeeE/YedE family protein [Bacteroidales bacterium]MBN2758655.1 YeeE/YedE family protein [Bacteroidales bacterium]